jgi:hypothetical protein
MQNPEKEDVKKGMLCDCGKFRFAGPGEFRNHESYLNEKNQWVNICPVCKREYKGS